MLNFKLNRNNYTIRTKAKVQKNRVNLEWYDQEVNVGDQLAPIVYNWMLQRKNIDPTKKIKSTKHLMTIGSLLGLKNFDATVWGSGFLRFHSIKNYIESLNIVRLDIRCVRGPITDYILSHSGYSALGQYGDPAILMPLIYSPAITDKKYKVSLIKHFKSVEDVNECNVNLIDTRTNDYKAFIDEICASEMVITSSLHGIILAEAYGVPAVFMRDMEKDEVDVLKYFDWYYSIQRYDVKIAKDIESAMNTVPMPLPDLTQLQFGLLNTFPYDLFE